MVQRFLQIGLLACLSFLISCYAMADSVKASAVDVWTHQNDNARTGRNLAETTLNTSNVNKDRFGLLYTLPVEGQVYTQPLYLKDVEMNGKKRNLLFVATMHNWVYCFDADDPSGAYLWRVSMGPSVTLPDKNIGWEDNYRDILNEVGVLSTPVIDKDTGTMYVVAMTRTPGEVEGTFVYEHKLHALDIKSGEEKENSPVAISTDYPGTNELLQDVRLKWTPNWQSQRVALTLVDVKATDSAPAHKRVYFGSASFGDAGIYFGWVLGYHAQTLQQEVVYNTTPTKLPINDSGDVKDGGEGGVWQSGQGLTVDQQGNVYFTTGNGLTDVDGGPNRASSVVKLNPEAGLEAKAADWYTPSNYVYLNEQDLDISTGALLIPDTNRLVVGSKEGTLYVLNKDNLGKFNPDPKEPNIVQKLEMATMPNKPGPQHQTLSNIHGTPVYWEGPQGKWIYVWGEEDYFKAFSFDGSKLSEAPVSQSTFTAGDGMPGGFISITADGNKAGTGIAWVNMPVQDDANMNTVDGVLRAFDASDLTKELWNSEQLHDRDSFGKFSKFTPPTITNGKVYMTTFSNKIAVYGLFPSLQTLTLNSGSLNPQFSPDIHQYSVNVPYEVSAIDVTGSTFDPNDSIKVRANNTEYPSGHVPLLHVGSNLIQVDVSGNGKNQTSSYSINVNVAPSTNNPTIRNLELTGIALDSRVVDSVYSYKASVPYSVQSTNLIVELNHARAEYTTTINGKPVNGPIQLDVGTNILKVDLTEQSGTHATYTVQITRDASDNAWLGSLTIDNTTLSPTVTGTVYQSSASVANGTGSSTVTAVTYDAAATHALKLNGGSVQGTTLNWNVGTNQLDVEVTSANGQKKQTYTVTITRAAVPSSSTGGSVGTGWGGGGGAPAKSEPDDKDAASITLNLDVNAKVTQDKTPDGQAVTLVTIDESKLSDIIRKHTKGKTLIINVAGDLGARVVIPTNALQLMADNWQTPQLQLTNGVVTYNLPLDGLGSIHSTNLTATLAKVTGAQLAGIQAEVSRAGAQLLIDPVSFSLAVAGNTVSEFEGDYDIGSIHLGSPIDPASTTVVWPDQDGSLHFVPSTFVVTSNSTQVNLQTPRHSVFAVIRCSRTFEDVKDHWSKPDVELLANKRIVDGVDTVRFLPDKTITRAEFAVLLVSALGLAESTAALPFQDVKPTDWFAGAVAAAYEAGLIGGFEDQSFRPGEAITREQMAMMIARAMKLDRKEGASNLSVLNGFRDSNDISIWAQLAAAQAVNAHIIEGTADSTFDPHSLSTRAQATVMLKRMLQALHYIN